MIERLKSIISQMGLSDRAFALKCGIAQNTLSRQLSGAREVSLTTISAVLENNPEISAEWLLRGNGEMLLTSEQPTASNESDRLSKLIDTIAFQQDTINNLQRRINELETTNKRLEVELTIFKNNKLIG
jgi:transcriptional regulator with XRE-family HTH domain